jgi:hypothetical protein
VALAQLVDLDGVAGLDLGGVGELADDPAAVEREVVLEVARRVGSALGEVRVVEAVLALGVVASGFDSPRTTSKVPRRSVPLSSSTASMSAPGDILAGSVLPQLMPSHWSEDVHGRVGARDDRVGQGRVGVHVGQVDGVGAVDGLIAADHRQDDERAGHDGQNDSLEVTHVCSLRNGGNEPADTVDPDDSPWRDVVSGPRGRRAGG